MAAWHEQKQWTFTIVNPIARWRFKRRMVKAVKRWNESIAPMISELPVDEQLKWDQLVWQEIDMWIRIGEHAVVKREFEHVCERRKFNDTQRSVLRSMMAHVGMPVS